MINIEAELNDNDVAIWQVMAGKITELKIHGDIFVVKQDTNVDPVKAAKDFINAFDIKRTAMVRKIKCIPEGKIAEQVRERKSNQPPTDVELVDRINNIPVYKEYVISFYKKYPDTFVSNDLKEHLTKIHKGSTGATMINKTRTYIKYLLKTGFVEQIEGKGNYGRVYKFKEAPFGASLPAQPDYDSGYLRNMRQLELLTIRDR